MHGVMRADCRYAVHGKPAQTEVVYGNRNPEWQPNPVTLQNVDDGSFLLVIEVWDWNKKRYGGMFGTHRFLGAKC